MTITPTIWFCIIAVSTVIVIVPYYIISLLTKKSPSKIFANIGQSIIDKPFSVSAYYDRIEKATLDILETQKPVDQIIILWWGLDGLRLNEDGSLEWISRKEPEPVNQNIFYQPAQPMAQASYPIYNMADMCQSTQAQINALQAQNTALQMQSAQQAQNVAMMAAFTPLYPSYSGFQQGLIAGTFPLTGCCCDQTILR